MSGLHFHVKVKSDNQTKTIAQTRGFSMIIDEPGEFGGTNTGANPVEYVLASLGGCLNVVVIWLLRKWLFPWKVLR